MAKYRKKPVVVEAVLFDGELVGEPGAPGKVIPKTCPDWFPAVVREVTTKASAQEIREGEIVHFEGKLWIGTHEGPHQANPGDMLIRGVKGEIYPCKPEIFAQTYDMTPVFP